MKQAWVPDAFLPQPMALVCVAGRGQEGACLPGICPPGAGSLCSPWAVLLSPSWLSTSRPSAWATEKCARSRLQPVPCAHSPPKKSWSWGRVALGMHDHQVPAPLSPLGPPGLLGCCPVLCWACHRLPTDCHRLSTDRHSVRVCSGLTGRGQHTLPGQPFPPNNTFHLCPPSSGGCL